MTTVSRWPVDISLIESEHEFFAKTGPVPTSWNDIRRFPRFYHRACVVAKVHPVRPGDGPITECFMLTRDLSRGGLSLLHSEQLFPGQWIDVHFHNGVVRRLEVLWCRCLNEKCYSLGCRFVKADAKTDVEPADENSSPAAGSTNA